MKLKDAKTGIRYVVKRGGTTLYKGDRIKLDDYGCLLCLDAGGWLSSKEWKNLRNEIEVDVAYYKQRRKELEDEMEIILLTIAALSFMFLIIVAIKSHIAEIKLNKEIRKSIDKINKVIKTYNNKEND